MNHNYQLSPPKRETKPNPDSGNEASPVYLILGAFCATPKIHFDSVIVGTSRKRTLIVRNPNESPCFLNFCKRPSAAFELNYGSEDTNLLIPGSSQITITITWTPKEEGQHFEAFQVQPSTGGARLSVHLLGKALPPPKKPGAKRRPGTAAGRLQQPIPPKANDPSLQLTVSSKDSLNTTTTITPVPSKLTIPHSPNFSTRFDSKTSSSSGHFIADKKAGGDSIQTTEATDLQKMGDSNPDQNNTNQNEPESGSNIKQMTPDVMSKLKSLALPFTPEPSSHPQPSFTQRLNNTESGNNVDMGIQEEEEAPTGNDTNPSQATFIVRNDAEMSALASPARRETYLVAPSPMVRNTENRNTNVPELEDCPQSARHVFAMPTINSTTTKSASCENKSSASTSLNTSATIELDSNILDRITKTLDNELDYAAVHRSFDTILGQVEELGNEQQRNAIAAFSGLTELDEESIMDVPIDLEEEDAHLAGKAVSGEFLCMDHLDLEPNFPQSEVKVETEAMASIKQMLKDGKTKEEIIDSHANSTNTTAEIRALYEELVNKYKSCRECYEVLKKFHLSEAFTFHRIVIKKAIENKTLVLKDGIDIRNFQFKTQLISSLLCSYSRPWLWSALCLVFNNDKLIADDIDMMNFIDENLFWNNEIVDLGDPEDGNESPKEFLELLGPRFLQKYLEIVLLLDETDIPSVFLSNLTTKKFLDNFATHFLGPQCMDLLLEKIPLKLTQNVDPIQYLIEENLRGPNIFSWTNIVRLVQELANDPSGPEISCNTSSVEAAKESLRAALQEAQKMGIPCNLDENNLDFFFDGGSSTFDENFLWQLVLRIRIAQCEKLQGCEE